MRKYILLVRHGSVDRDLDVPDKQQSLEKGGDEIKQVASRLADFLHIQPAQDLISIGEIWHGTYRHVQQTAGIIGSTLKVHIDKSESMQVSECKALDPETFRLADGVRERHAFGDWLLKRLKTFPKQTRNNQPEKPPNHELPTEVKSNAIMVVGHAPHVGWIAERILRRPQPITRAEVICIAISDFWLDILLRRDRWLTWAVAPSDPDTTNLLREKIESKKKLAEILGGLITALLGILLGLLLDPDKLSGLSWISRLDMYISAGVIFVALGLYLATAYAYDRLLMPKRFWAEKAAIKERKWLVQRPPSSDTWILYQNMIRVWNWMFTPATCAVILGLLFLGHAVFKPDWITVVIIVPILLLFYGYYRRFRPTLGTED